MKMDNEFFMSMIQIELMINSLIMNLLENMSWWIGLRVISRVRNVYKTHFWRHCATYWPIHALDYTFVSSIYSYKPECKFEDTDLKQNLEVKPDFPEYYDEGEEIYPEGEEYYSNDVYYPYDDEYLSNEAYFGDAGVESTLHIKEEAEFYTDISEKERLAMLKGNA